MSSSPNQVITITDFDHEHAKRKFLKLLEKRLSHNVMKFLSQVYQLHTKERIEQIVAEKISTPSSQRRFIVTTEDGKSILHVKKKAEYLRILTWEEIFDKCMPLHISCGHRGKYFLKKEIEAKGLDKQFSIPGACLEFFKRVCNTCVKDKSVDSTDQLTIGLVYMIGMTQTRSEEKFRYLLIYVDMNTHYTLLRPLTAKTGLEISMELFKLFTQFGPPDSLHVHGYNSALTDEIRSCLKEICPEFGIEIEHQPARYDIPTIVTDKIQQWVSKTNNLEWEVGCFIVQAELNNDPHMRPRRKTVPAHYTPHILYFHTELELTEPVSKPSNISSKAESTEILRQHETKKQPKIKSAKTTAERSLNEQNEQHKTERVILNFHTKLKLTETVTKPSNISSKGKSIEVLGQHKTKKQTKISAETTAERSLNEQNEQDKSERLILNFHTELELTEPEPNPVNISLKAKSTEVLGQHETKKQPKISSETTAERSRNEQDKTEKVIVLDSDEEMVFDDSDSDGSLVCYPFDRKRRRRCIV